MKQHGAVPVVAEQVGWFGSVAFEQVSELLRISRAYGLDLGLVQRRHPLRERGLIVVEHPGVSTRKRHEMRTEFRYRP